MRKIGFVFLFLSVSITLFALSTIQVTIQNMTLLYPATLVVTSLNHFDTTIVSRVVDGDTVYLEGTILGSKQLISTRLIGVDTPEAVDPRKLVQYFGQEASNFTKKILDKQNVYVTYDQDTKDKYDRLLAYIWIKVDNKFYMFNAILVLNGYAHNYPYFPFNEDYMKIFHDSEIYARENELGLWKNSDSQNATNVVNQIQGSLKITSIDATSKDEYVEIKNISSVSINLKGWKIKSDPNQLYSLPNMTLMPGESIKIHSGSSASGQFIWTKKYIWRDDGDICWLYDPSGKEVDVYEY
ncbi:MAG: thermonuclease family protein [Thermotogae bacterium]|nr:thermonuclease family protein [Thermotogota bacterium]